MEHAGRADDAHQGVDHLKAMAGQDEQFCLPLTRLQLSLSCFLHPPGYLLQHPHRRGSHRDDPPPLGPGAVQNVGGLLAHLVILGVDTVLPGVLPLDRTEGVQAHVQGHEHLLYPGFFEFAH